MTPPHADTEVFDKLPGDAEHRVHEFLRISEVCALRGVSTSWRMRTGEALQHKYRWDLSHVDGVDVEAHVWLEHLSKASINTRSLRVVRHWCTQFIGACQLFISFFWRVPHQSSKSTFPRPPQARAKTIWVILVFSCTIPC